MYARVSWGQQSIITLWSSISAKNGRSAFELIQRRKDDSTLIELLTFLDELEYQQIIRDINPLTPMSDQDRISPYKSQTSDENKEKS